MTELIIGLAVGLFLGFVLIASEIVGTRDECRAANPGHDCNIGWIAGDAFQ